MTKYVAVALIAGLALTGCGSKKKNEGGGGGAAGQGGGGKAAGGTKPYKFATLGITGDLPTDVDTSSEEMLVGPSIGAMGLSEASTKRTLDEAKQEAQDYSPQNVKGEALPDGWVLTYDNKGELGANFFLEVQRDIGGKTIRCSTTQPNNERIGAVLAVCKSLRP